MRALSPPPLENLSIGELSKCSGVTIDTIRYYERIKMLPAPIRTESGRRIYGPSDVRNLRFIRRLRELRFSLGEIRALLRCATPQNVSCRQVRELASRHLEHVRCKIAELAWVESVLAGAIGRCSGEAVRDCPFLEMLVAESGSKTPSLSNVQDR